MPTAFPGDYDTFPEAVTGATATHIDDHKKLHGAVNAMQREQRMGATYVLGASDSRRGRLADARCDGVDDHLDLAAAVAALPAGGGTIQLLDGTYSIGGVTTIDRDNVVIRGLGEATKLVVEDGANTTVFTTTQPAGLQRRGLVIRDLSMHGNRANQTSGTAIELVGTYHALIEAVRIREFKTRGIKTTKVGGQPVPAYNTFRTVVIEDGDGDGFHLVDSEFDKLEGCEVHWHNQPNAVAFRPGWHHRFVGCQGDANWIHWHLEFVRSNQLIGCVLDRAYKRLLQVTGQGGHQFVGCKWGGYVGASPDTETAILLESVTKQNHFLGCAFMQIGDQPDPDSYQWSRTLDESSTSEAVYVGNRWRTFKADGSEGTYGDATPVVKSALSTSAADLG